MICTPDLNVVQDVATQSASTKCQNAGINAGDRKNHAGKE